MDDVKKLERIKVIGKGHLDPSILSRDHWTNPEMSGWLIKEGAMNRNLKKRFFVLKANRMMYFKDEQCTKIIGYFTLNAGDQVAAFPTKDLGKANKTHKWRIATQFRTWKFQSEQFEDMKKWIHHILKLVCPTHTFGMLLHKIIVRESVSMSNVRVPVLVQRCIQFLRDNDGASNEGIFRMSGEGLRIKELKKAFNTQLATEVVLDPSESVHNISNLMKIFLRELEDSLIPIRYFDELKDIAALPSGPEAVNKMKPIIQALAKENYDTMAFIFKYLKEVEAKHDINKMTSGNISLVFGPCLVHANDELSALEDAGVQCFVAKILLDYYNDFFVQKPSPWEIQEQGQLHHQGRQFVLPTLPRNMQIGQRGEHSTTEPTSPLGNRPQTSMPQPGLAQPQVGTQQPQIGTQQLHVAPQPPTTQQPQVGTQQPHVAPQPPTAPKPTLDLSVKATEEEPLEKEDETLEEGSQTEVHNLRPRSVYTTVKPLVPPPKPSQEEQTFVITSIDDLQFLEDEDGVIDLSRLKL